MDLTVVYCGFFTDARSRNRQLQWHPRIARSGLVAKTGQRCILTSTVVPLKSAKDAIALSGNYPLESIQEGRTTSMDTKVTMTSTSKSRRIRFSGIVAIAMSVGALSLLAMPFLAGAADAGGVKGGGGVG
jgi:hypothetical protein